MVVIFPLGSVTLVGRPRSGSMVVVATWPRALVTVTLVGASPVTGVYAVVVTLPYGSAAERPRP